MSSGAEHRRWLVPLLAALAMAAAGALGCGADGGAGGTGSEDTVEADTTGTGQQEGESPSGTGGGTESGETAGGGGDDSEAGAEPDAIHVELSFGVPFMGGQAPAAPVYVGTAAVGDTTQVAVTLRNPDRARTLTSFEIEGDHAGDFSIAGGSCRPGLHLRPSGTCDTLIALRPSAPGERRAELVVGGPPVPAVVELRGTASGTPGDTHEETAGEVSPGGELTAPEGPGPQAQPQLQPEAGGTAADPD